MQNEKLAQWVTTQAEKPDTTSIKFKMSGRLPSAFDHAVMRVIATDIYRVWLNGKPVGIGDDWQGENWRVTDFARAGQNSIEIEVHTRKEAFVNCWLYLDKELPTPAPSLATGVYCA